MTTHTLKDNKSILDDIEQTYGAEVAKALTKYCSIKNLDIDKVVLDPKSDGNGMTAWDKFDIWAQRKQHLNIMDKLEKNDNIDWTGAEDDRRHEKELAKTNNDEKLKLDKWGRKAKKSAQKMIDQWRQKNHKKKWNRNSHALDVYDEPNFDTFNESSGQTSHDVIDFIAEELNECEWVSNIDFDDYSAKCYVETDDGKSFIITVDQDNI